MTQYFNSFFKNYFNISDHMSRKDFWLSLLLYIAAFFILCCLIVFVLRGMLLLLPVFILATIIPFNTMTVRRFNDAGFGIWTFLITVFTLIFAPIFIDNKTSLGALTFITTMFMLYVLIRDSRHKTISQTKWQRITRIIAFILIMLPQFASLFAVIMGGVHYYQEKYRNNEPVAVQTQQPEK